MDDFTYHAPTSIDQAAELLSKAADGTLMSGGQTLIPILKQRLASHSDIIDLSRTGMTGIAVEGDAVTIKAGTCHADVAASSDVAKAIPALANLAGMIGDPHVRNRGTIGGSIATNDPAGDYPAACLGLGATIVTNKREIAADDFFVSLFETALDDNEIVTGVTFPVPERAGYAKFPNPASRFALAGVFVAQTSNGARVAVTGAGPCVFRAGDLEQALNEDFSADALSNLSVSRDGLSSDMHADAEYRAHLVGVMARRAVAAALG